MVASHVIREIRQNRSVMNVGENPWKALRNFLSHPIGLLVSLLVSLFGPAFVVCLAGGSMVVFGMIVCHNLVGMSLGAIVYKCAIYHGVTSIISPIS
jgi:hypothetical protein